MDSYGYAAALNMGLEIFDIQGRRTGRTMRLVEQVTDEDQVIVPNADVARHLTDALRAAGKVKTRVIVVGPNEHPLSKVGTEPRGRTFMEHTWVRAYYKHALDQADRHIEMIQRESSKTWPAALPIDPGAETMLREDLTHWR